MIAYEFYYRDPIYGDQLIGLLPERRKDPGRITWQSVMNWGRKVIGEIIDLKELFFIQVNIDENTGKIIKSDLHLLEN